MVRSFHFPEVYTITMNVIAGIDEAGRGALAGPVVAGACVITTPLFRRRNHFPQWSPFHKKSDGDVFIADSKLLSPEERERSYAWIIEHCHWGVGIVSHIAIDKRGILRATELAMLLALEDLRTRCAPTSLLIDGRDNFRFPLPHQSIIRGDQTEPAIAAGSIIAKVTRDRIMREQALHHPLYGFEGHKGYGSERHIATIREHGPCELHRKTFLLKILENQELPLFADVS